MDVVPFYLNWTFWQWVVSLTALGFATAPTIRRIFAGHRIEMEVADRIHLAHTMGNPNINLFMVVRNTGGKTVRIRSMELHIKPDHGEAFIVQARTYHPRPGEDIQAVLAPFKLDPNEEWAYPVYFWNVFSRKDDKEYRQTVSALRNDIIEKRHQLANPNDDVEAAENLVTPAIRFFNERFKWQAGEYELTVRVNAEPIAASTAKKVRLALFESDETDLRSYTETYKYGLGVVYFDIQRQPGISIPISNS